MRIAAIALALAGCASSSAPDVGLEGLALTAVAPVTIIPGTKVVVAGSSFVDVQWGATTVHLTGTANGQQIDARWPATFVDFSTMTVAVDAGMLDEMGGDVDFRGQARIDVIAASDGDTYSSDAITVELAFREKLTPSALSLNGEGVIFVNDEIVVEGDGFLLGGDEGATVARVSGCFVATGQSTCKPIAMADVPMVPVDPLSRKKVQFPFGPKLVGIKPGEFRGSIAVVNKQKAQSEIPAAAITVTYDLVTSQIFEIGPTSASLGQFVFMKGGGFVGGEATALTEIELAGSFKRTGAPSGVPITMNLIPEFVEGRVVRYVLNTDDDLGQTLDLREVTGDFTGTVTPIVSYGADRVRGASKTVSLSIAPVKQVVYLQFQPTYVEGLRDFGLRAVDKKIRDRIVEVCKQTYKGVNIDFRTESPTDFALFESVELVGVDPNGTGLFGYDNSPGKDNGNLRLYDRLGGVNALTQQDGYAGYGGVFIRSLMGFSKHPANGVSSVPGADPLFDKAFDPFRPDLGNDPIRSADLSGTLPSADGTICPGGDRKQQVACAIYIMGNLIGGTLAHEIGHSLGLANPFMEGFHNAGDAQNRIMDAGGDRPFVERAELSGHGPGVFCDDEYAYLRMVLPSKEAPPSVERPGCF
jgi:hypothetical protein